MTPDKFKAYRLKLKVSQPNLGKMLGIAHRQVMRYELGQSPIPGPIEILMRGYVTGVWPDRPKVTKGVFS